MGRRNKAQRLPAGPAPESGRLREFATSSYCGALLLVLLGVAAYSNSLDGPFIFDDEYVIRNNPNLGGGFWESLAPPPESAAAGRPVVAASIALNYACGGFRTWGYHAFNLTIHLIAGLLLYGIVRRTFALPWIADRLGEAGPALAFVVPAVWLVHPLQTEAVDYIIQRTELLVGMFYLATLYFAIRAWGATRPLVWQAASVASCALGMASKEVMVSAPLIVLLYDRAYRADGWRELFSQRRAFYSCLAATWLVLLGLMLEAPRARSVGFHLGASPWEYLLLQGWAIGQYLRLALAPVGLCVDYGEQPFQAVTASRVAPGLIVVTGLLGLTAWAWRRRPAWGFLGAWFFCILAPSSSFVPIVSEIAAERRMYLPLAAVAVVVLVGAVLLARWLLAAPADGANGLSRRVPANRDAYRWGGLALAALLLIVLIGITRQRNDVYRSVVSIWQDTIATRPENRRPYEALGRAYFELGRIDSAIDAYQKALRIDPDYIDIYANLGAAYLQQGKLDEAVGACEHALSLDPRNVGAHENLAVILQRLGRDDEAVHHYEEALRIEPHDLKAYFNYAIFLFQHGRFDEAEAKLRAALEFRPRAANLHNSLSAVLQAKKQFADAEREVRQALDIDPTMAIAWDNLARIIVSQAQATNSNAKLNEAAECARRAIQLDPNNSRLHNTAGMVFSLIGKNPAAVEQYQLALLIDANNSEAELNLGKHLALQGNLAEAAAHWDRVLRIDPANAEARRLLQALRP